MQQPGFQKKRGRKGLVKVKGGGERSDLRARRGGRGTSINRGGLRRGALVKRGKSAPGPNHLSEKNLRGGWDRV